MKTAEGQWMRSNCIICGREFPHKDGENPVTCGKFDCLQEANRRGLLESGPRNTIAGLRWLAQIRDTAEKEFNHYLHEDAEVAENMRDYWKHQQSGAD